MDFFVAKGKCLFCGEGWIEPECTECDCGYDEEREIIFEELAGLRRNLFMVKTWK